MDKIPIRELIGQLEQEMKRQGYKEATLNYYRNNWRQIVSYFESSGEMYFSETTAMKYIEEKCNFFEREKSGELTESNIYLFRTVRMIGDFAQHGAVLRRYHRSLTRVNSEEHQQLLERFKKYCENSEYSKSTQDGYGRTAENFLCFIEAQGISLKELNPTELTDFVRTLMGYSYKMVEFVLCGTRAFLRFLHAEQYLLKDLSGNIPCLKTRKHIRIPSIWKHDDLMKLLEAVDRGNPAGKRDYAIILLVARLGLRIIDVKNLKFENFNWNENIVELTQTKTKYPVRLPLLKDVGWAVIDYIQNGRPTSESQNVFLRHLAPIEPFSEHECLYEIIIKYMKRAKLPIEPKKKVGMHTLRHTLATTLMEHHTPIEDIANILGHQNTDTTPIYLKSTIELLRECALNPEVE